MNLKTKIFADGADLGVIEKLCKNPVVKGFTTNPTLMRRAGVTEYETFAHAALAHRMATCPIAEPGVEVA